MTHDDDKKWRDLADDLTYINYCANRDLRPDIPIERYIAAGYKGVPEMEARYQAERAVTRARATAFVEWAGKQQR